MTTPRKPYCDCSRGRGEGWAANAEGIWVHPKCGRPSQFVYEKIVLPRILVGGATFDAIIAAKRVFAERVDARELVEIKNVAINLDADVRLVEKIWRENE